MIGIDKMSMDRKRILIIDDHPIFRLGLKELINQENDLQVCGEVEKPTEALSTIADVLPDMILIDLALEQEDDGLELITQIREQFDTLPLLVISMYDESRYAEKAIRAGANGYIMKQEALKSVIKAIQVILNGNIYISRNIMNDILTDSIYPESKSNSISNLLTEREMEVFYLIGKGKTTNEIANALYISPKTIGTYRERIKEKLSIKHSSELIKTAVAWMINQKS
jgi:DNA-binding NarL/FixJ family response regulator